MVEQRKKRVARPRAVKEGLPAEKAETTPPINDEQKTDNKEEFGKRRRRRRAPKKREDATAEPQVEAVAVEAVAESAREPREPRKRRGRDRDRRSKDNKREREDVPRKPERTERKPVSTTPLTPIEALRARMSSLGVDGFLVPSQDSYLGEYVPDSEKRLAWLTGFTGSNGLAIVAMDEAAFFTDGRYVLQAGDQVDPELYARFDLAKTTPQEWAAAIFEEGKTLAFDPWLHTETEISRFASAGCKMLALNHNLIDDVWENRPAAPCGELAIHEYQYTGEYTSVKRERIGKAIKEAGADALIITAPDSLCWLLNIRGSDVPNTPFIHARGVLYADGQMLLFIDRKKLPEDIKERMKEEIILVDADPKNPEHSMAEFFGSVREHDSVFMIDNKQSSCWFFMQLNRHRLPYILGDDPIQLAKACKNEVEQQGARDAHVADGVAVIRFLHWLDDEVKGKKTITELSASEALAGFREQSKTYRGPSFDTISGFGANGAIVHYRATEASNATFKTGNLYLIDSGGQYPSGTTDITRTVAIGKPKKEHKHYYTHVLKGHIALAMASFPEGTTGSQLDTLARAPLWKIGADYAHGTGHGVGSYLSVHEGPQRISKMPSMVALKPGMILSNEPGFYLEGECGIRIENLVLVVEDKENSTETQKFLKFETLTKVPFDTALIEKSLLTKDELAWVNAYHENVLETVKAEFGGAANKTVKAWLEKVCKGL